MEDDSLTLEQEVSAVRDRYLCWKTFMDTKVQFSREFSDLHSRGHCARVLLFSLLLARRLSLPGEEEDALALCSCFHDSRRRDEGLDTGHGLRAADYYRVYCTRHDLPYDPRVYHIMAWHDRHDADGLAALEKALPGDDRAVLLYRIFKDSDALDRFRLGPAGLDPKYLRTAPAPGLVDFARDTYLYGRESLGLPPGTST